MFTKEQIEAATAEVRTGADYPRLVQNLKELGVRTYEHMVADGSNIYYGDENHSVRIAHAQKPIPVADRPSAEKLKHAIGIHQRGQTTYPEFCQQAGEAGVSKWDSDLEQMTVTYVDRADRVLVVEPIPG
jgi:uncharacterized protein YbcV (DUF1398 family)